MVFAHLYLAAIAMLLLLSSVPPGEMSPVIIPFIIVWGLLGVSAFLFFHSIRDAALKRRVWPWFSVGTAVIFAVFVYSVAGRRNPGILGIMVPALVLITWMNLRMTRFCDACGTTITQRTPFSKDAFCSRCGAPLN